MLAVNSYEQNEGFSVIGADELFFINGGSGASASGTSTSTSTSVSISNGSNQGYVNNPGLMVAAIAIAGLVGIDTPTSHQQAIAQGIYTTFGGTYGNSSSSGSSGGSGGGGK